MEPREDCELVHLVRSGQKEAFGELVERYQPMVRRLAYGMRSQEDWVQEVTQEAFLAAYLSLEQLREPERFSAWLYSIVLNVARTLLKERKLNTLSLENLLGGISGDVLPFCEAFVDPQEVVEEQELHCFLLRAVQALSSRERAATLLFYYEQLSLQEIAAILDISVTAVKSRLFKARDHLRQQLLPVLQVAPAAHRATERKRHMIHVVIETVREHPHTEQHVVVLRDEAGQRYLPIWIGRMEALTITLGLAGITPPRPLPAHFLANVLTSSGVQLEEVCIEALKSGIYYAVARIRNGERVSEIDARPSDVLGLAALLGCPIFVAEDVLMHHGMALPEGKTIGSREQNEAQLRASALKALEEFMKPLHAISGATEESFALVLAEDA
jgi:RNA polymerase sigma factor (sigma-70 family)